jgi:hypothetical protein
MDVGTEPGTVFVVGDGTGVNPLNTGVDIASVAAREGPPRGVDACSVANRSEVGAEAGPTSPHPRMKSKAPIIQISLVLVIIEFN